jgi:ABC-type sugar transport system permease subunit
MRTIKKGGFKQKALYENIFAFCVLIYFFLSFLVFWVYANINNIMLAFQEYDPNLGEHVFIAWEDNIFSNFTLFFENLFSGNKNYGWQTIANGAYFHVISSFVCLPFSYMIAFIIYKKLPGTGFYKVVMYLPAILSGMVTVWLYRHIVESGVLGIMRGPLGMEGVITPFRDYKYDWTVITIYVLFYGLPGSLLINLGSMSRVPHELVEYGELEGISLWKEFTLITVPMIFPVLQVQCLGLFSGFFTAQGPLFTFYQKEAPDNMRTFGYNLFSQIARDESETAKRLYGYSSAVGLTIGLVSIPIVQATKWLFDKLDPGAEF